MEIRNRVIKGKKYFNIKIDIFKYQLHLYNYITHMNYGKEVDWTPAELKIILKKQGSYYRLDVLRHFKIKLGIIKLGPSLKDLTK